MSARLARILKVSTLLAALLLLLSACGGGSNTPPATTGSGSNGQQAQDSPAGESLEELAKQEGTLTWYTATPIEAATPLGEAFTAATGIKVEIFRQTGGPLTETFYAEVSRGDIKADVITHSEPSTMVRFGQEGLLIKYDLPTAGKYPQDAIEALQGYAFPDRLIYQTVTYNRDLVTGEDLEFLKADPYEAILDPRFKGQVTLPDPNVNGSIFNHLYGIAEMKGGWESAEARAWFEALAANEPIIFNSNGPAADAVIGGEAKIALIVESFAAPPVKNGAPIGILYPRPTLANFGATGIVANSPHPNAARYFLEWLMDKEGQEAWNKAYDVAVGHADAVDSRDYLVDKDWYDPPQEVLFVKDLLKQDEDRDPFLEFFNEVFGL